MPSRNLLCATILDIISTSCAYVLSLLQCVCRRHMLLETARAQQQVPQHFDCARADSLENATCAGNRPSNTQRVEVEIPIVQSIQPSFQRPLGGATSNVPNRSAMLRAEWTIPARQAVLRFAQMKY